MPVRLNTRIRGVSGSLFTRRPRQPTLTRGLCAHKRLIEPPHHRTACLYSNVADICRSAKAKIERKDQSSFPRHSENRPRGSRTHTPRGTWRVAYSANAGSSSKALSRNPTCFSGWPNFIMAGRKGRKEGQKCNVLSTAGLAWHINRATEPKR